MLLAPDVRPLHLVGVGDGEALLDRPRDLGRISWDLALAHGVGAGLARPVRGQVLDDEAVLGACRRAALGAGHLPGFRDLAALADVNGDRLGTDPVEVVLVDPHDVALEGQPLGRVLVRDREATVVVALDACRIALEVKLLFDGIGLLRFEPTHGGLPA